MVLLPGQARSRGGEHRPSRSEGDRPARAAEGIPHEMGATALRTEVQADTLALAQVAYVRQDWSRDQHSPSLPDLTTPAILDVDPHIGHERANCNEGTHSSQDEHPCQPGVIEDEGDVCGVFQGGKEEHS